MDSGTTLRMTAGVALIVIISVITISITSSLSVGGIVYSEEPETCASCHYEVLYVEGWKESLHGKENVTCMDCHRYTSPITDEWCLTCHQDYGVSNTTKFPWFWYGEVVEVDAHAKMPHFPADCTTCHLEHKFILGSPRPVTESLCSKCHAPFVP